jgi:hypothetical protein
VKTAVPFLDLAREHAPLAAELRAAFDRVFGASAFVLGDEVEQFEFEFADYCGVKHCVGVASGTAALMIMLQAAGIGPGDEVIVPAHTFIATALAVLHAGATPVCVDVQWGSGLIDPQATQAAIGPSTTAILAVHLYGQACAMDPLREIADRNGLVLLEPRIAAPGREGSDSQVLLASTPARTSAPWATPERSAPTTAGWPSAPAGCVTSAAARTPPMPFPATTSASTDSRQRCCA